MPGGKWSMELWACSECGFYPIKILVEPDGTAVKARPQCPRCQGFEVHWEKVYLADERGAVLE